MGFAAAGAAVAVALRAWVVASPFGGLDADEAVWGLMTMHALDGDLALFFWGQAYGGTQEVLLGVPVFVLAGAGTASVRVAPLLLFALAAVLVWRIGRRLLGEPGGTAAAVFYAVWPAYVVWKSTRAHGFYGAGSVCALVVVLQALRLAERPASRRDAVLLGVALGLGWWATPQTAFVTVPALVWLVATLRRRAALLWPALPAALLGAAPWLAWNLTHSFASFDAPFEPGDDTYADHVRTFLSATLPTILGVRVPFTLDWPVGELAGRAAELAMLVLLVVLLLSGRRRSLLGVIGLAYLFLQAFSPFAALNEEPRYLVLLAPMLALALAAVVGRDLRAASLTAAALVALSVVGLRGMARVVPAVAPVAGERVHADLQPALATLDRLDQRYVRAPYEIAYRITFETRERIVASSLTAVRHEPYQRIVAAASRPAYVFVRGSTSERQWRPRLTGYRRIAADGWSVFVDRTRSSSQSDPADHSTNTAGRLPKRNLGCNSVTQYRLYTSGLTSAQPSSSASRARERSTTNPPSIAGGTSSRSTSGVKSRESVHADAACCSPNGSSGQASGSASRMAG